MPIMGPAPQQRKEKHRAALDAVAGGLAGALARVVVGPLDVLKIRFQVQLEPIARAHGSSMVSKYTGLGQALVTIVREEGVQVGLSAVCMQHACVYLSLVWLPAESAYMMCYCAPSNRP